MLGGSAMRLVKFAKECKDKKLRSFSSYKTKKKLSEVLEKYGIVSCNITRILQFIPPIHTINESAPEFKLYIDDILHSNEAMQCEYISTILHTAVSMMLKEIICITEGKQNQATIGIYQNLLQCRSACDMNINMNKKKKKVDDAFDPDYDYVYGIVSTGTDWYFILHSTEGIYSTSRTEYRISLTEDALKDDTKLRKNVKRVLEVIVGLLKDRAVGSEELATKKRRVEEIIKKK
ncbi:hypothetical protein GLOIN_2v1565907 [Rhizophagus irregularis DAOM 181602=DAOM 197198]|uniref:Uncharacterized protein n=2 Tax=Rhizophagus irregularis TaxID=588596 RepID=A0A2P4QCJ1_RHIID|nr:hypothetical protein GLOIN_2v1565907 [Rhizophagus irregularis DAOM 181602=DAOM 197198]POG75358.1 hypothetical protein GLOIN_2v1565907 [Rhizophagus irregularis DAOM 181602=DAOM 197198]|eukprot:XP_025182224.1 hypothetical protein GLOIN_2v1565907 [Rhizophagus irregularis DAOM 181602=DAOM 197198]